MAENKKIRVLYSFPHQIGASRICYTAWQQVKGLADAGADILLFTGVLRKPLPTSVKVRPTLAWGKLRISYKIVGAMRACRLHDRIVARRIKKLKEKIDIIHCWPLASLRTLETAAILGIPTVLERPNAHTRFALDITQEECEKLGVFLPRHHEHGYDEYKIKREEEEYRKAYRLLCPSDFVVKTFLDKGYPKEQLVRHIYGFDEKAFSVYMYAK